MTDEILLPQEDKDYLESRFPKRHQISRTDGYIDVVISAFGLPETYGPRSADLLIRLPPGYRTANPDMFWTHPEVKLASGGFPDRADVFQEIAGRRWQRWSRHFPANKWRAEVDGLRSYIAGIRKELAKGR